MATSENEITLTLNEKPIGLYLDAIHSVVRIDPYTPATEHFKIGDRILRVNGIALGGDNHFLSLLLLSPREIQIDLVRGGSDVREDMVACSWTLSDDTMLISATLEIASGMFDPVFTSIQRKGATQLQGFSVPYFILMSCSLSATVGEIFSRLKKLFASSRATLQNGSFEHKLFALKKRLLVLQQCAANGWTICPPVQPINWDEFHEDRPLCLSTSQHNLMDQAEDTFEETLAGGNRVRAFEMDQTFVPGRPLLNSTARDGRVFNDTFEASRANHDDSVILTNALSDFQQRNRIVHQAPIYEYPPDASFWLVKPDPRNANKVTKMCGIVGDFVWRLYSEVKRSGMEILTFGGESPVIYLNDERMEVGTGKLDEKNGFLVLDGKRQGNYELLFDAFPKSLHVIVRHSEIPCRCTFFSEDGAIGEMAAGAHNEH